MVLHLRLPIDRVELDLAELHDRDSVGVLLVEHFLHLRLHALYFLFENCDLTLESIDDQLLIRDHALCAIFDLPSACDDEGLCFLSGHPNFICQLPQLRELLVPHHDQVVHNLQLILNLLDLLFKIVIVLFVLIYFAHDISLTSLDCDVEINESVIQVLENLGFGSLHATNVLQFDNSVNDLLHCDLSADHVASIPLHVVHHGLEKFSDRFSCTSFQAEQVEFFGRRERAI